MHSTPVQSVTDLRVTVLGHPVAAHWTTVMCDKTTGTAAFRQAATALATMIAPMALEGVRTDEVRYASFAQLPGNPEFLFPGKRMRRRVVVIPILYTGELMVPPIIALCPHAGIGPIGLERQGEGDEIWYKVYYRKLPKLGGAEIIIVDPMLATAGSIIHVLRVLTVHPYYVPQENITVAVLFATPTGIRRINTEFPGVRIVTANLCEHDLTDKEKWIVGATGDCGDRLRDTEVGESGVPDNGAHP